MDRDTKFGYGFLFLGAALPYLIDQLVGPRWAFLSLAVLVVLGVGFLYAGHRHDAPVLPTGKLAKCVAIVLFAGIGVGIFMGARRIYNTQLKDEKPMTVADMKQAFSDALAPLVEAMKGQTKAQPPVASPVSPNAFISSIHAMYTYTGSGLISIFMVGHPSVYGFVAAPVYCLLDVLLTNLQDHESTIDSFTIAVSLQRDGGWRNLPEIPLSNTKLYLVLDDSTVKAITSNPNRQPLTMGVLRGPYGFDGNRTADDLKHVIQVIPEHRMEDGFLQPIAAHGTIKGWMAFDADIREGQRTFAYFRITAHDTAGAGNSTVVQLPPVIRADYSDPLQSNLTFSHIISDISSYRLKWYSEPFLLQ